MKNRRLGGIHDNRADCGSWIPAVILVLLAVGGRSIDAAYARALPVFAIPTENTENRVPTSVVAACAERLRVTWVGRADVRHVHAGGLLRDQDRAEAFAIRGWTTDHEPRTRAIMRVPCGVGHQQGASAMGMVPTLAAWRDIRTSLAALGASIERVAPESMAILQDALVLSPPPAAEWFSIPGTPVANTAARPLHGGS